MSNLLSDFIVDRQLETFYSGGVIRTFNDYSETSSSDGLLRTWMLCANVNEISAVDLSNGNTKKNVCNAESDSPITSFCLITISPVLHHVIIAYQNGVLQRYALSVDATSVETPVNSRLIKAWKSLHRAPVLCMQAVSVSPLGNDTSTVTLATGSADSTCKVWDLERQYCTHNLKDLGSPVSNIQLCVFGKRTLLLCGTAEGRVQTYDLSLHTSAKGSNLITTFSDKHTSSVTSFCLQRLDSTSENDSCIVFSAGRDQVFNTWRLAKTGILTHVKMIACFVAVEAIMQISDDFLLGGCENGELRVWNLQDGGDYTKKFCSKTPVQLDGAIISIVPLSKDEFLVSTEAKTIFTIRTKNLGIRKTFSGSHDEVLDVTFLKEHIAVATNSCDLRLYDRKSYSCQLFTGLHTDSILSITSSRKPKVDTSVEFLATCSKDNTVGLWSYKPTCSIEVDNNTFECRCVCIARATGHTHSVTGARFAQTIDAKSECPNFMVSVSEDMTLKVWNLVQIRSTATSILESADQVDREKLPHLTSHCTVKAHDKNVTCVDISPNDKLILTGSMDKSVKLWAVEASHNSSISVDLVATILGHRRGIWDAKFSPVDQVIATASGDSTIKLFAIKDQSCLKTFEGHDSAVLRLNFAPSGIQLLSVDSAGLMKLWTIKTSECVRTMDLHEGKVWAFALEATDASKESKLNMVTGGSDSKINVIRDITEEEKKKAIEKMELEIAQDQQLSNLIEKKKFVKALKMAIRLERPHSAFKILKSLLHTEKNIVEKLVDILTDLEEDQVITLLGYVSEWNMNGRNTEITQSVLQAFFQTFLPEDIIKWPGISSLLETLMPYTERHFDRISKLKRDSHFLEYTFQCMNTYKEE